MDNAIITMKMIDTASGAICPLDFMATMADSRTKQEV
jgi:hypothetical protein